VQPSLLSAVGHGEADPVAPNNTAKGRAKNRRVELTLGGPAS
jgi:outer membrane protein OmpA-like peptidoglycan-associated protein